MARERGSVPHVLVTGMSLAVAGSVVVAIAPEASEIRRVMVIAALLLMAMGYLRVGFDVSSWTRPVLVAIAVLQLAWLAWVIARPYVRDLEDWEYRALAGGVWWSGIVLLSVAARAWWRPATPWVVVAAALALTLEALPWAPYLAPAFDNLVDEVPALASWIRPLRELLTSAMIIVLVRGIRRRTLDEADDYGGGTAVA